MKLLFDENLSPTLPRLLAQQFPNSLHVRDCGLKGFSEVNLIEDSRSEIVRFMADSFEAVLVLNPIG